MAIIFIGAHKKSISTLIKSWITFYPNYLLIKSDDYLLSGDVINSISKEIAITYSKLPLLLENSFIIDYYIYNPENEFISDSNIINYLNYLSLQNHTISLLTFENINNISNIEDEEKDYIVSQNELYINLFKRINYKLFDIKYYENFMNIIFP